MGKPFIHLHTHSHYSLLSALPTISNLVSAAKKNGMAALALTDNGNLYGAIEFYKECKKQGIKPIIGIDAYLAGESRFDRESSVDARPLRLVLLSENNEGYKNLLKLVTASFLEGFHYRPRIDREILLRHHGGLIAILPSVHGEISHALKTHNEKRARETLSWYQNTFGSDSVFLEITHQPTKEGHGELVKKITQFAKDQNANLVAAHDVFYRALEDKRAWETLTRIQSSSESERNNWDGTEDLSFIDNETAQNYFNNMPEALENTLKIGERCTLNLTLGSWVFPNIPLENGETHNALLRRLAYEGIEKRGLTKTPELTDRLEYELSVITEKGYAPYFLVVSDLLHYAHEHDILTSIRGSVAGSLVTYLAGITNVNPLEYKLPFERFLNRERPSPPDIDMDFADDRRDEMIEYVKKKYGEDKVAQIGTFGTMMARAAVRDIARALGHPYGFGDRIAKLIPFGSQGFPMTIDRAMEETPELAELYKRDDEIQEVIDLAKKIEGCVRHISVHAAGVVISPTPLTDFVPLQFDPKGGKIITQYDMHGVEDAGLLKFDFLGIKNLAILSDAVGRTKEARGVDIDIENIPLNDKKTFDMLGRGETLGLFQLNGSGMTRFLKELKPSTIHDINAMVALYRPGPMESIPSYIERKHNSNLVRYLDPRMEEILSQSYGVLTYQDDVLLIAITLAGFSWLEADALRKAMGKKIPAEMAAQKEKLLTGFIKNGLSFDKGQKLWKLIEPFAAYGFNKAHAASYGKVAYQTAYMKANFPLEYMAAVLTADAGDVDKIAETIGECKRMGIPVLPPDVNQSYGGFTVNYDERPNIRFGLHSIKNFGTGVSDTIIEERTARGPFISIANFLGRIQSRNLNKKSLEALIKCDALHSLGERGSLLANIDTLLSYSHERSSAAKNQDSLFADFLPTEDTITLADMPPASQRECLTWEKELLGLYVSGHPLDKFKDQLARHNSDIKKVKETVKEGVTTVLAGIISETRPVVTKAGAHMSFIKLADFNDSIEVVVFPKTFSDFKDVIVQEKCIAVKGRLSGRNGELSLIAETLKELQ